MRVADLKLVAKCASIDTKGNKTDLILRLQKCHHDVLKHAITKVTRDGSTFSSSTANDQSSRAAVKQKHKSIKQKTPPSQFTCPICQDKIIDKADGSGDDSIFCEGICDTWIHRQCARLSITAFKAITLLSSFSV